MTGQHLHFMGIGGVGMCGLAEVYRSQGYTVSGCDLAGSERTRRLEGLGLDVEIGHSSSHLDGIDVLVVSSAVVPDESEYAVARETGVVTVRRAELLGELMRTRRGVAVAGTHGKTTTTALIGHILTEVGEDPMVIVGGRAHSFGSHARAGSGSLLVCEADEYDRSFLELTPQISVITNIEAEHLDCYGDSASLENAFASFANRTSVFGTVVLCADDPGAMSLRGKVRRQVVSYGGSVEADVRMVSCESHADGTRIVLVRDGRELGTLRVPLVGAHNARNAVAAITVGLELGLDFETLATACAGFPGVARRFEVLGQRRGVTVVDDYAHHPTELAAVLEAVREAMPGRRVVAVFQPHLFSRTRDFANEFAAALLASDVAVVLPVYPARERPIEGVNAQLIVSEAERIGHPMIVAGSPPDLVIAELEDLLREGDVLLTLGAGDVDLVGKLWLEGGS